MIYSIYSDGSSHSKGGKPGGWAYVIVLDGNPIAADMGNDPSTTNNVMELMGALQGIAKLSYLRPVEGAFIELVCDSQYALGIANGSYVPSKNQELAHALRSAVLLLGVGQFRWVPGHTGDIWNSRCDSLAKEAKLRLTPEKRKTPKRKKAKDGHANDPK